MHDPPLITELEARLLALAAGHDMTPRRQRVLTAAAVIVAEIERERELFAALDRDFAPPLEPDDDA